MAPMTPRVDVRRPLKFARPRHFTGALLLAAALAALPATTAPAAADWLVTRDGARIETRGAWQVDGRRVLFTLPNGTLSAIRSDEVDLDKSALATAEARAPLAVRAPEEATRKEPVLRLTEKDIPPSSLIDESEEPADGTQGGDPKNGDPASALEVISWEKTENSTGDGVEIFGTIKNGGPNMMTSPSVLVAIYDADGGLLATNSGTVNSPQIAAGKTANFRVAFPGVPDFASVRFDAQGRGFKQRPETVGGAAEEEEGEPVETEIEATDTGEEPPPTR